MRKRILFLLPYLAGGGAERVFSTLLRHCDRTRFEPHLAVLQSGGKYAQDIPSDITVHDLDVARARYSIPSIVRLVWTLRPQTVLSTLWHLNFALILSRPLLPRGTRLLVRETTTASAYLLEDAPHPEFWNWLYCHLYKRADRIVCASDAMMSDLVQRFNLPREKLVRIYNPIDAARIRELAQEGGNP